jgi:hypothetical protein
MALTGISEFTFGFAFLSEQANRNWPLKAVPILPSLQQEADEGWDAKLPTDGDRLLLSVQTKRLFVDGKRQIH